MRCRVAEELRQLRRRGEQQKRQALACLSHRQYWVASRRRPCLIKRLMLRGQRPNQRIILAGLL